MPRIDLSVLNDYVTANLCADFSYSFGTFVTPNVDY